VPLGVNPLVDSHKQITIKKILHDLEKELNQVEEENYNIVKEQAEVRLMKQNPKAYAQLLKQIESQSQINHETSPIKNNKLQTLAKSHSISKKLIKNSDQEGVHMLRGQFQANIKLNKFEDDEIEKVKPVYTYQQHRFFLKKKGVTYFEDYEPPRRDTEDGSGATKGN
jgi:hypothetical protein